MFMKNRSNELKKWLIFPPRIGPNVKFFYIGPNRTVASDLGEVMLITVNLCEIHYLLLKINFKTKYNDKNHTN